ncbi:MAG TPA: O-antigen ligase family protein [Baekduia sp.]|uniref:O-antigen ligase family protein n=1 Tax=Baekduia sp. TaxID=2600305 RepID=UPI002B9AEC4B|nr:O-antigen ligase family protein [Baekduia sp.]HMJ33990.1 O-antigen ligase family protein [Baekduia sp.]
MGSALAVPAPPGLRKERVVKAWAALAALLAIGAGLAGFNPLLLAIPLAVGIVFTAVQSWLLQWRVLLAFLFLVILLVPMKRYALLPGALPFKIEPYRLLIAGITVAWLLSILVEPRMRIRKTGLSVPLLGFFAATLMSEAVNVGRIGYLGVGSEVVKGITFLTSFVVVVYVVSSLVTRRRDLEMLVRVLVVGGTFVALAAIVESRTGINIFDKLHKVFPPLKLEQPVVLNASDEGGRGGRLRVFASAEHPIALSAALAMLVPLAIYLAKRDGRWQWWLAAGAMAVAVVSTVSRTGIVMLMAIFVVYLCVQPAATRRALPLLLPMLIAMHVAVPGAIGGLKSSFFPQGGLVAQQQYGAGTRGSGRLADLGPGLAEWRNRPWFGQGYSTRITDIDNPHYNAPILDNQWLGLLLEIGIVGAGLLMWLFCRVIRRLSRFARRDPTAHGWLLAGLAASLTGYVVGMFTYDAFNFTQVTFLAFILVGLAVAALSPDPVRDPHDAEAAAPARVAVPVPVR